MKALCVIGVLFPVTKKCGKALRSPLSRTVLGLNTLHTKLWKLLTTDRRAHFVAIRYSWMELSSTEFLFYITTRCGTAYALATWLSYIRDEIFLWYGNRKGICRRSKIFDVTFNADVVFFAPLVISIFIYLCSYIEPYGKWIDVCWCITYL